MVSVSYIHIFVMIRSADVGAERSECFLMGAKCADMTTRCSVWGSTVKCERQCSEVKSGVKMLHVGFQLPDVSSQHPGLLLEVWGATGTGTAELKGSIGTTEKTVMTGTS